MNKLEFRQFIGSNKHKQKSCEVNNMPSVTDPRYAQSGRDILMNPIPYEQKPIYSNGIPLNEMQSFDGMYKDKFEAFQQAKDFSETNTKDIKEKLSKIEEEKKQQ